MPMMVKGSPNRPNALASQPPGGGIWTVPSLRSRMPDAPAIQNSEKPKKKPKNAIRPSCCPLRGSRRMGRAWALAIPAIVTAPELTAWMSCTEGSLGSPVRRQGSHIGACRRQRHRTQAIETCSQVVGALLIFLRPVLARLDEENFAAIAAVRGPLHCSGIVGYGLAIIRSIDRPQALE